jgi:hypothetical protein
MEIDKNLQERMINWLSEAAQNVTVWAGKEIPPFINEYLQWKFWENMVGIGVYILFLIVAILGYVVIWKFGYKVVKSRIDSDKDFNGSPLGYCDRCDYGVVKWLCLLVWPIIFIIVACATFPRDNIFTCLKIKIAPKVYLIEEAVKIVK